MRLPAADEVLYMRTALQATGLLRFVGNPIGQRWGAACSLLNERHTFGGTALSETVFAAPGAEKRLVGGSKDRERRGRGGEDRPGSSGVRAKARHGGASSEAVATPRYCRAVTLPPALQRLVVAPLGAATREHHAGTKTVGGTPDDTGVAA